MVSQAHCPLSLGIRHSLVDCHSGPPSAVLKLRHPPAPAPCLLPSEYLVQVCSAGTRVALSSIDQRVPIRLLPTQRRSISSSPLGPVNPLSASTLSQVVSELATSQLSQPASGGKALLTPLRVLLQQTTVLSPQGLNQLLHSA